MAHVKVIRRSMRPEEYNELRVSFLKRRVYTELCEVAPVMVRNAHQTGDVSFDFYDETPVELRRGELCYTPDGSLFFTAEADVSAYRGKDLLLYYKTSSEVIVKVNGRFAGGFDPNRSAVPVSGYAQDGRLRIEMLGFNRSKPDDERNPETYAGRGCRQVFGGLFLVTADPEVQSLCYDAELLTELCACETFDEAYRAGLVRKLSAALDLIDFDDFRIEDVRRAAAYIGEHVYGDKTWRGSGRAALVAHSHLDIAYYWRRCHSVQKNLRTVLIQMRLMDRYPEFTYCHTQPFLYETLERYYPEVFAELQEKVAAGRFEPVGAMYVESDCNVPGAESLIRQCLYGQHFYRRAFGLTVDTCWLPDVFGNSWILPQILQKSGVKYFVSNKMSTWNDTNRFPHNHFLWRGIDGTDIYACVPPTHFISWNEPGQVAENWEQFQDKETGTETLCMFGYGDGGSGVTEDMLERMRRFEKLSVMPRTRHVTAGTFLRENFTPDRQFAVWDGELYLEMHRGTFTTKSELKRYNRRLEEKFRTAELLCVLRGGDYPAEELRRLWKLFLLNQFHDILPGSHITPVYEDAMADLKEVDRGLDMLIGDGGALFNTLNFPREGVEFLPDDNGPFLRENRRGRFARVAFPALSGGEALPVPSDTGWFAFAEGVAETPLYRIAFTPDGGIASLYDKALDREWVREGSFNRLRLYDDRPGVYDAWDILPDTERPVHERPLTLASPLSLRAVTGECAELTCTLRTDKSEITRLIRLFRSDRAVEVEHVCDWQESHKLLKVDFEPDVLAREVTADTSAGFIRRPLTKNTSWEAARFECCTHKWTDMSETGGGVAVINDGKYGIGLREKGFSLSLLRATERPDPLSDLGPHDFCYRILPHAGDHVTAGINRLALLYNAPLVSASVPEVPGLLRCFEGLYLQSVKQSEDGSMTVVRLTETDGARGTLRLPRPVKLLNLLEDPQGESDVIPYRPFEILTLGF